MNAVWTFALALAACSSEGATIGPPPPHKKPQPVAKPLATLASPAPKVPASKLGRATVKGPQGVVDGRLAIPIGETLTIPIELQGERVTSVREKGGAELTRTGGSFALEVDLLPRLTVHDIGPSEKRTVPVPLVLERDATPTSATLVVGVELSTLPRGELLAEIYRPLLAGKPMRAAPDHGPLLFVGTHVWSVAADSTEPNHSSFERLTAFSHIAFVRSAPRPSQQKCTYRSAKTGTREIPLARVELDVAIYRAATATLIARKRFTSGTECPLIAGEATTSVTDVPYGAINAWSLSARRSDPHTSEHSGP